jgi:hypothetical protein
MNRFKILILAFLTISLMGCATNNYVQPNKSTPGISTISGYVKRDGLFKSSSAMIEAIDDKPVGLLWSESSKIRITPGKHQLTIHALDNRGAYKRSYYTDLVLPIMVKPGMHYTIKMGVKGVKAYVWAQDVQGKKVGSVVSEKLQLMPEKDTTYVPMYIKK